MKILLMTDMEGTAGILNHDDWVSSSGRFYDKGMRLLTGEVNAAVAGFCEAGVSEILVVDGHGAGGIDPEALDARAQLLRGRGKKTWPWGLDNTYSGLAFVGQHAKAGTPYSHITHTQWFNYRDMQVNGLSIGEYGQLALCAMELGVPTILACGEQALCDEATALTPGVVTVAVKRGLLPDGLDELDAEAYRHAKLSAVHLAPAAARARIREGAAAAAGLLRLAPQTFRYPTLDPPYSRVCSVRRTDETPPGKTMAKHPDSIIALMNTPGTPV